MPLEQNLNAPSTGSLSVCRPSGRRGRSRHAQQGGAALRLGAALHIGLFGEFSSRANVSVAAAAPGAYNVPGVRGGAVECEFHRRIGLEQPLLQSLQALERLRLQTLRSTSGLRACRTAPHAACLYPRARMFCSAAARRQAARPPCKPGSVRQPVASTRCQPRDGSLPVQTTPPQRRCRKCQHRQPNRQSSGTRPPAAHKPAIGEREDLTQSGRARARAPLAATRSAARRGPTSRAGLTAAGRTSSSRGDCEAVTR
jgi:hypothetical protein